jgi:hypothetical protein
VSEAAFFHPPVRQGLIIHGILLVVLLALGGWGLMQAFQANIGLELLLYLFPALLFVALSPPLFYQAYALYRAVYRVERNGVRLRWGLRVEDIPIDAILRVYPASELGQPLPVPGFYLPGSLRGRRALADGRQVEFLAVGERNLVIIETADRLFVISPAQPEEFINAFHQYAEMGSLTPFERQSIYPSFLLARVWNTTAARYLILAGLILGLLMLAGVSLVIPGRAQVFLGFNPAGEPRDPVPAVRLFLLPVLNGFVYIFDFLFGLYLFRKDDLRFYAYLVWGGSLLTAVLFTAAVIFILVTPI